ncbi:hypothetical protein [Saccharothrix deserti]|uniref:hypothetical protein n=1 Tax=Saccharothrix deserti TaxID=2593674 RepID=UPI00131B166B|nr:hypothetical protein [Saccharothrix deserti]
MGAYQGEVGRLGLVEAVTPGAVARAAWLIESPTIMAVAGSVMVIVGVDGLAPRRLNARTITDSGSSQSAK